MSDNEWRAVAVICGTFVLIGAMLAVGLMSQDLDSKWFWVAFPAACGGFAMGLIRTAIFRGNR